MYSDKEVNKYWRRHARLMKFGFKFGLICGYGEKLLGSLRNVYYGGVPASIILLNRRMCVGKCYDRAVLACLGLEDYDYSVVHANVDSIRYNKKTLEEVKYWLERGETISDKYPNHCFIEVNFDGRMWVIDTTDGLIYDKKLYYLINHPDINCVRTKQETLEFPDYVDVKNADFEKDKWILPTLLPVIEEQIEETYPFYKDLAKKEIAMLKEKINYDDLCKQARDEMNATLEEARKLRQERTTKK